MDPRKSQSIGSRLRARGPDAVLGHASAAALWGLRKERRGAEIEISTPADRRRPGITAHRRSSLEPWELVRQRGIPVTHPISTLVDLAPRLTRDELEAAIGEADRRSLASPPAIRAALDTLGARPGVRIMRTRLDRRTFRLSRSRLERIFRPIAHEVGLGVPETNCMVNGFEVDFCWPDLRLVVETDGLSYHRTPAQQAADRLRDQAHTAAGCTPLRFTHEQVGFERPHVKATLEAVARRLRTEARST